VEEGKEEAEGAPQEASLFSRLVSALAWVEVVSQGVWAAARRSIADWGRKKRRRRKKKREKRRNQKKRKTKKKTKTKKRSPPVRSKMNPKRWEEYAVVLSSSSSAVCCSRNSGSTGFHFDEFPPSTSPKKKKKKKKKKQNSRHEGGRGTTLRWWKSFSSSSSSLDTWNSPVLPCFSLFLFVFFSFLVGESHRDGGHGAGLWKAMDEKLVVFPSLLLWLRLPRHGRADDGHGEREEKEEPMRFVTSASWESATKKKERRKGKKNASNASRDDTTTSFE